MAQPTLNEQELEELAESLEIAIATEQQAKELCKLAEAFAQKYEKRLHEIRQAVLQEAGGIE